MAGLTFSQRVAEAQGGHDVVEWDNVVHFLLETRENEKSVVHIGQWGDGSLQFFALFILWKFDSLDLHAGVLTCNIYEGSIKMRTE